MLNKLKSIINKDILIYILIFIICLLMLNLYFINGMNFIVGDDSLFHISNISVLTKSINFFDFKFIPSIVLPTIANNLGYGIGIFYPRLPQLTAAYISYLIGGNVIIGYKLTHILVLFLSGVLMYKFTKYVSNSRKCGFFASVFYITAGYTVTDFIVRDAFSETFLFLFFPLAIYGLYELYKKNYKKFYLYFILAYIGMLNSHLVTSIYLTFACLIYILINYKLTFKKEYLTKLFIASFWIIILYLPEAILLLQNKFGTNYMVFAENVMSSDGLVTACAFSPLAYFIYSYEGTLIQFVINPVIWVLIFIFFKNKKNKLSGGDDILIKSLAIMGLVFMFLTTRLMPWKYMPDFLLMIQFPWRLEIVVVFVTSFLASLSLKYLKQNIILDIIICLLVLIPGILFSLELINENSYSNLNTDQISNYALGWSSEYLPVSFYEKKDMYLYSKNSVITSGLATISNEVNKVPYYDFDINTNINVNVEVPRIYYLGYTIKFNDKEIDYYESENGLISFDIKASGHVSISYTGTNTYRILNDLRIISIIGYLIFVFYNKLKQSSN